MTMTHTGGSNLIAVLDLLRLMKKRACGATAPALVVEELASATVESALEVGVSNGAVVLYRSSEGWPGSGGSMAEVYVRATDLLEAEW